MQTKLFLLFLLIFSSCGAIDNIPYSPELSPDRFCELQPCFELSGLKLVQPTSAFLVYLLALLSIYVGAYFIKIKGNYQARLYWGISLILGGIGAFLAGTSYQAFAYEIKCAGRDFCVWTSYWEIAYNAFTVAGAGTLLLAILYGCGIRKSIGKVKIFVTVYGVLYLAVLTTGLQKADSFLLSFEMMLLFSLPLYLAVIVITIVQFYKHKTEFLSALLLSWLLLSLTIFFYFIYLKLNITQLLWQNGIWFSENDVLHLGMLFWIIFVWKGLGLKVKDQELKAS